VADSRVLDPNCKFAILAMHNGRVDVPDNLVLQDDTGVWEVSPFLLEDPWRDWLGSIEFEKVNACNLFLVRSSTSGWPEGELAIAGDALSTSLQREVGSLFAMLRWLGPIEYEEAFVLAGHVENGNPVCRHFGRTERFNITRGYLPWVIREKDLRNAVRLYQAYSALQRTFPSTRGWRFGRGCIALKAALEQFFASDRLHGFVRSLESLILPGKGRTEKDFVSRCAMFSGPKAAETSIRATLLEAYKMHCDIEHMHDWDNSLQNYPEDGRENIALWRTRQMEALACAAYVKILLDAKLAPHFSSDATIEAFWKRPEGEIRAAFGNVCDITALKLVKDCKQFGRANPEEWPPGLFEDLRPRAKSA